MGVERGLNLDRAMVMHILEQARAVATARRADADRLKADLLQRMNDVIERERAAAFLEGAVYVIENGLSGLAQIIAEPANAISPTVAASSDVSDGVQGEVSGEQRGKRRPVGANEALVMRIINANSEGGIATRDLVEETKKVGEPIADSSCRVALNRLTVKGDIIEIDGKWFPNLPAGASQPEGGNGGSNVLE